MASIIIPLHIAAPATIESITDACSDADGKCWYYADKHGLIWERGSEGKLTKLLIGHKTKVIALAFLPVYQMEEWSNEQTIASLDSSGAVAIWGVTDGRCLLYHQESALRNPNGMIFVQETNILVVGDEDKLIFFNAITLELVYIMALDGLVSICGHRSGNNTLIICRRSSGYVTFVTDNHRAKMIDCDWISQDAIHMSSSSDYRNLLVKTPNGEFIFVETKEVSHSGSGANFINNNGKTMEKLPGSSSTSNGGFFSPSCLAHSQGKIIVGGSEGQYGLLEETDLFSNPTVYPGPLGKPISAILVTSDGTVWMGDEAGGLFSFPFNSPDQIKSMYRVSQHPLNKIMEFGNYLLVISTSFGISIIHSKSKSLLYTISDRNSLQALYFGTSNHFLVEYEEGILLRLALNTGLLEQVESIGEEYDQRVPIGREKPKGLLDPILHLFPHGLLKVLNTTPCVPGMLFRIDIRALILEMPRKSPECCRLSSNVMSLLISNGKGLGIVGANGNISVSLQDRHGFSPTESSIALLAYLGLAMSSGEDPKIPPPIRMTSNKYPSLSVLSKFYTDYVKPLERASRLVFNSILQESLNYEPVVLYWQERLRNPPEGIQCVSPMNRAAIILAILSLHQVSNLLTSPTLQRAIGTTLLSEIQDERKHLFRISAVHLFGKCFGMWEAFVDGPLALRLLVSGLNSTNQAGNVDPWTAALLAASRSCILDMLQCKPELYNSFCNDLLNGAIISSIALSLIFDHIQQSQDQRALSRWINLIAETVVRMLDPANARQRARLLPLATPLLYTIVTKFSKVAFHSTRQLLASGRSDGVLTIWDVRTAIRILKNQVHTQPINCVLFDPTGYHVLSCSYSEPFFCVTNIEEPSIISSIMSLAQNGGCRRVPIPKSLLIAITSALGEHHDENKIRVEWTGGEIVTFCVEGQNFTVPLT